MKTTTAFILSAALAAAATASPHFTRNATEKRYVIMDNDWSSTGFIPFLLAADSDMEILALTSSTADSWQYQEALHALATLEIGNLSSCIPVVQGATYPLINTYERFQAWEAIHGTLVWQGVFAPYNATAEAAGSDPTAGKDPNRVVRGAFIEGFPNGTLAEGTNAAKFMVEQVYKHPGQVSIYAAGSMTNVALAVRMDSRFARLAKELVIMGGYVDTNFYQADGTENEADINTDINLMIDPEAARIALTADFPSITIAGNVANQVISTQAFLDEVHEVRNPYSDLVYNDYGTEFPFWDETAAALMIDPSLSTNSTTVYFDVDIAYGSPSYGNAKVYQKVLKPPNVRNVTYVHSIDAYRFKAMLKRAVQYPPSCATLHYSG